MLNPADNFENSRTELTNSASHIYTIKKILSVFGWLLIFALLIECFIWNSYYWTFDSAVYKQREITLPYNNQLKRNALIMLKESDNSFMFANINQMVRSVRIEAYGGYYAVYGSIHATSQNHAFEHQRVSNFTFAPGLNLELNSPVKEYQTALIKFDLIEPVLNLYVQFDNTNFNAPLAITKIVINPAPEFNLSLTRVILMIINFFLLYVILFSKLYQHDMEVDSRLYKLINRGILVLMLIFSVGILLADHPKFTTNHFFKFTGWGNTLGFYPYNNPNHSLLQDIPKTQKELGEVDLYIALADALFVKHQLNLDLWVDPKLLKLNNMYDISERKKKEVDYYIDRAFYNGKYYCYFGLAPILLIYAPIYYITGMVPASVLAVFLATVYALFGMHALSSRLTSLFCDRCNTTLFIVAKVTMYMASFVFYLQAQIDYYRLPIITTIAALCLALYFGLGLLLRPRIKGKYLQAEHHLDSPQIIHDPNSYQSYSVKSPNNKVKSHNLFCRFISAIKSDWNSKTSETLPYALDFRQMGAMFLCGLCVVLVVMGRPLTLIYLITSLSVIYALYLCKAQQSTKAKFINSLCLIIPVMLGAIVVSLYNYYRFDSIFEFGAMLQLTGDDINQNKIRLNLAYLKTLFFYVLFGHIEFFSDFPFVAINTHEVPNLGQYVLFDQRSGLLMYPYYWGLFLIPLLWSVKRLSTKSLQKVTPPLQHALALRGLQLIISIWYVLFPIMVILIGYNAGWSLRYIVDITSLAAILPFLLLTLVQFNWSFQADRVCYIALIFLCICTITILFFLTINNYVVNLNSLNPRLYLILKDIFDPLGFS